MHVDKLVPLFKQVSTRKAPSSQCWCVQAVRDLSAPPISASLSVDQIAASPAAPHVGEQTASVEQGPLPSFVKNVFFFDIDNTLTGDAEGLQQLFKVRSSLSTVDG